MLTIATKGKAIEFGKSYVHFILNSSMFMMYQRKHNVRLDTIWWAHYRYLAGPSWSPVSRMSRHFAVMLSILHTRNEPVAMVRASENFKAAEGSILAMPPIPSIFLPGRLPSPVRLKQTPDGSMIVFLIFSVVSIIPYQCSIENEMSGIKQRVY
jgi:hypothetical protein